MKSRTTEQVYQLSQRFPTLLISGLELEDSLREFDLSWVIPLDPVGYFKPITSALMKQQEESKGDISTLTLNSLEQILAKIDEDYSNSEQREQNGWHSWHDEAKPLSANKQE